MEVHESQVVGDDPLKRVEVQCSLQTRNASDELLFAQEAHANVVSKLG